MTESTAPMTAVDLAPDAAAAVLVVDDNAGKRLAVRAMLAPLGYSVIEADSGRTALRAVLRQPFAVILMDVRMPTMDGYETAKLIRQRSESELTPVIFVTAFGRDETETATAYASGAVDFIFTPILPDVLRAKVSAFVELFLQAEELQRSVIAITALNAALRDSEVRAQGVLENVADGIITASAEGMIESFNGSAQRLFGYTEAEILGQPVERLVAPSHRDGLSSESRTRWSRQILEHGPALSIETVAQRRDGSLFPVEAGISVVEIGERTLTIGCVRDISGRKAYTDALEQRTLHDDLTGLANRTLFSDRLERAIASADRADEPIGVLVIDLDRFGAINTEHGRETGDALLVAVGKRLSGIMHDTDTVARLGGDEFVILPAAETDVGTAATIAWKVGEAFDQPFLIGDATISVRPSIGMAFFPQHGRTTDELLRRADLALNQAKRSDTGLAVFVGEAKDRTAQRLTMLNELRQGIAADELVLHFQPKVDLTTRRTIGVEALVRWRHPTQGLLSPDAFIPEAESSDLVGPLTRWVLDAALGQQRRWRDAGLALTMAVNVSARSLSRSSSLPQDVATLTESWDADPSGLVLELTENAMIDDAVPAALTALHAMGKRLAIDDFGTGHSSLLYLQRLPIDELKVDRSFVQRLATVPADATIVRSTIDLAHNLGLTVVAEGVEDAAALDMLVAYGCDCAQGYLFSRPLPADELTEWLAVSPFGAS
jgi:diguanylate cyclase (GGDEF)-like protein/PAS domain S-box-containing protein